MPYQIQNGQGRPMRGAPVFQTWARAERFVAWFRACVADEFRIDDVAVVIVEVDEETEG